MWKFTAFLENKWSMRTWRYNLNNSLLSTALNEYHVFDSVTIFFRVGSSAFKIWTMEFLTAYFGVLSYLESNIRTQLRMLFLMRKLPQPMFFSFKLGNHWFHSSPKNIVDDCYAQAIVEYSSTPYHPLFLCYVTIFKGYKTSCDKLSHIHW